MFIEDCCYFCLPPRGRKSVSITRETLHIVQKTKWIQAGPDVKTSSLTFIVLEVPCKLQKQGRNQSSYATMTLMNYNNDHLVMITLKAQ